MNCNCKNGQSINDMLDNGQNDVSLGQKVVKYTLKTLGFLILLLMLPIINLVIIWYMFSMLVLNKNIDVKPLLVSIGRKFKEKEEDEYISDEDFSSLTEEDVVMVGVEDITDKVIKG